MHVDHLADGGFDGSRVRHLVGGHSQSTPSVNHVEPATSTSQSLETSGLNRVRGLWSTGAMFQELTVLDVAKWGVPVRLGLRRFGNG